MLTLTALLVAASTATPIPDVVTTKYKVYRRWEFTLPNETWMPVGEGLSFAGLGDEPFATRLDGTALLIDGDGDGLPDLRIASEDTEKGATPLVVLKNGEDGARRAIRLSDRGGWHFGPAGAVVGEFNGVLFKVIDQDCDGRFDGIGKDALVVGRGESAAYLSEVVTVGDELFRLEVAEDGSELRFSSFEGESGVLDVHDGYQTDGKLQRFVVRDLSGRYSFDLGKASDGLRVPVGAYRLEDARVVLGKGEVEVTRGKLAPMDVEADEDFVLEWGGPLEATFDYARQGAAVQFRPDQVWYRGFAGEIYAGWDPRGESPKFTVKAKETGEVLVDAIFPGSS